LRIVVCPTVREPDGLAVSSRNQYLSPEQRADAAQVYQALRRADELIQAGERRADVIRSEMRGVLERVAAIQIEYASLADAETLEEVSAVRGRVMAAIAVRLGPGRLIDNILVDTP
jgi:pantoate--beta-alanine ligase